jgi:cytochrome c-type biogenesis protein CcmH
VRALALVMLLCLSLGTKAAGIDIRQFDSPAQEARYKHLIEELRCTVCQNQNIAGSNAELAQDLRRKTYQMVREGRSDEEILDYMVERYGNFVLYRPPFNAGTALLWVGPFVVLAFGALILLRVIRSKKGRAGDADADLSEDKLRRAEALLREEGEKQ